MFDLGMILTLYPPPTRPKGPLTAPAPPRQADVSAVSAAPVKVLTCPVTPSRTGVKNSKQSSRKNSKTQTQHHGAPPPSGTETRSEER